MDASFTQRSGATPSSSTGPSGAADGTYYVYAETSGSAGNPNKNFDLAKTFGGGAFVYGISFQYHMYGATMGSAILESGAPGEAGTTWTTIWSQSGNLGDQWNQALVFAQQSPTMLRFSCVPSPPQHDDHL